MKLTTRTRYGTRLMVVLAMNFDKGEVPLRNIASTLDISEKYLSQIVIPLRGIGLIHSVRGAYGGYRLSRHPSEIYLKEIVDVLEGGAALVNCISDPSGCDRVSTCVSRKLWLVVDGKIAETLSSISLDALIKMGDAEAEP